MKMKTDDKIIKEWCRENEESRTQTTENGGERKNENRRKSERNEETKNERNHIKTENLRKKGRR